MSALTGTLETQSQQLPKFKSNYGSVVDVSVGEACKALQLDVPANASLIKLPTKKEGAFSIKSAAVILLDVVGEEPVIPMVKQIKIKKEVAQWNGTYSVPGGKKAKIEDGFTAKQVSFEKYFPLLTASRELFEELPIFKRLDDAYSTINQGDTYTLTNTGWSGYPVVTYIVNCSPALSERITEASKGLIRTEEVSGVAKIPLSAIRNAFRASGWTFQGFSKRKELIDQVRTKDEQADLSSVKQFDENLKIQLPSEEIVLASYVARTLFLQIEQISLVSLQFMGLTASVSESKFR